MSEPDGEVLEDLNSSESSNDSDESESRVYQCRNCGCPYQSEEIRDRHQRDCPSEVHNTTAARFGQ